MKPHPHKRLINAWADGAIIQEFRSKDTCEDEESRGYWVYHLNSPDWNEDKTYRTHPTCRYAIEYIEREFSIDAVDVYLAWLSGDEVEVAGGMSTLQPADEYSNPFDAFVDVLLFGTVTKKKKTVKQSLWVEVRGRHNIQASDEELTIQAVWVNEDGYLPSGKNTALETSCGYWHKVPSCTREVEAF